MLISANAQKPSTPLPPTIGTRLFISADKQDSLWIWYNGGNINLWANKTIKIKKLITTVSTTDTLRMGPFYFIQNADSLWLEKPLHMFVQRIDSIRKGMSGSITVDRGLSYENGTYGIGGTHNQNITLTLDPSKTFRISSIIGDGGGSFEFNGYTTRIHLFDEPNNRNVQTVWYTATSSIYNYAGTNTVGGYSTMVQDPYKITFQESGSENTDSLMNSRRWRAGVYGARGGGSSQWTTTGIGITYKNGSDSVVFWKDGTIHQYKSGSLKYYTTTKGFIRQDDSNANTGIGNYTLNNISSGSQNTAIGSSALQNVVGGYQNSAIGTYSLASNLNGLCNTAIGVRSLYTNNSNNNTSIGFYSLYNAVGSDNISIGYYSGYYNNSLSNRGFVNCYDQGSLANDTIKSILYWKQNADPAYSTFFVNAGKSYFQGNLFKTNTSNTITDTIATQAYARAHGGGSGGMIYPGAGIALSTGSAWGTSITNNSTNWNTAYDDRLKWDGGSTGLVAATGRTSLGATTVGANIFTLTNPSAITFLRLNADNTVTALSAANFKTALSLTASDVSLGNVTNSAQLTVTDTTNRKIQTQLMSRSDSSKLSSRINFLYPVAIAYTNSIPFTKALTDIADHTMTASITFTVNTTGAVDNAGAQIKLINSTSYTIDVTAFHVAGIYDNTKAYTLLTFQRKRGLYICSILNFD